MKRIYSASTTLLPVMSTNYHFRVPFSICKINTRAVETYLPGYTEYTQHYLVFTLT